MSNSTRKASLDGDHGGLDFSGPEFDPGYEDDLGVKWGESTPANAAEALNADADFDLPAGVVPSAEVERALADAAIRLINSTVGNSSNRRYVVLGFDMENVNPETTGGNIKTYSRIGTAEDQAVIEVAKDFLLKKLQAAITAEQRTFSGSLEI